MYTRPPLISNGSIALVAGLVQVTIVPAPGVDFRLRLVGYLLTLSRTAGAAIVDATLDEPGVQLLVRAPTMQLAATSGCYFFLPPPGLALSSNNTSIRANFNSSVAAGSGQAVVYYYIDRAT